MGRRPENAFENKTKVERHRRGKARAAKGRFGGSNTILVSGDIDVIPIVKTDT